MITHFVPVTNIDKPANVCAGVSVLISQTSFVLVCIQRGILFALICASVQKEWKERRSCKAAAVSLLLGCDLY